MPFFQQILSLSEWFLGKKYPNSLRTIHKLIRSFTKLSQYQELNHLYKEMLKLQKHCL